MGERDRNRAPISGILAIVQILAELLTGSLHVERDALPAEWPLALNEEVSIRNRAQEIRIMPYTGRNALVTQPCRQVELEYGVARKIRFCCFVLRIDGSIKHGVKLLPNRPCVHFWPCAIDVGKLGRFY